MIGRFFQPLYFLRSGKLPAFRRCRIPCTTLRARSSRLRLRLTETVAMLAPDNCEGEEAEPPLLPAALDHQFVLLVNLSKVSPTNPTRDKARRIASNIAKLPELDS
jgi:hypothetical protein